MRVWKLAPCPSLKRVRIRAVQGKVEEKRGSEGYVHDYEAPSVGCLKLGSEVFGVEPGVAFVQAVSERKEWFEGDG